MDDQPALQIVDQHLDVLHEWVHNPFIVCAGVLQVLMDQLALLPSLLEEAFD